MDHKVKNHKNGHINSCCVCNTSLITKKKLSFYHLLGSEEEVYYQKIGFCPKCGLIVTQNPFSSEQLNNRYKKMSKFEYDANDYIFGLSNLYMKQCKRQQFFINESIGTESYTSVLEVGAASGYNLSLYNEKYVRGIEPSKQNCELAKKTYGISMFNGMWAEYLEEKPEETYDLIILSMVLEHIVNPYQFIQECSMLTNQYIFIEVPTLDYRMQDEPYGMFCEEHVNIFTLCSLENLMKKAGFVLCNCEMVFNFEARLPAGFPSIMAIFKKSSCCDKCISNDIYSIHVKLSQYLKNSEEFLKIIDKEIDKIPDNTRLALWGIGHHASMLISNTSLAKKNIVRIYDNDRRKEGMDFMGQLIRPFGLGDAESNTDAILITTYTAQEVILSQLRDSGYKGKVYSLYA